jgi:hypothetical protein
MIALQVALLRNYTNGLAALVSSLKSAVAGKQGAKQGAAAQRDPAASWRQQQQACMHRSWRRRGCQHHAA